MSTYQRKKKIKILLLSSVIIFSTLISIIGAEAIVRILGYQPWVTVVHKNVPVVFEEDDTLGWRNKPGEYNFEAFDSTGDNIQMTIFETGSRRTSNHQIKLPNMLPKFLFIGGSYTQGWAISDNETFPWKIQKHFPEVNVLNYGTGGYGTYQSILMLEKILPTLDNLQIIFYAFIEHHETRNVATAYWQGVLARNSLRSHPKIPYATLDNNQLVRHRPEAYNFSFPLGKDLAIVSLLERVFIKLKTARREKQKRATTEKIILQIDKMSKNKGAKFVVIILLAKNETRNQYKDFFENNGIMYIDCRIPIGQNMRVKGEGHPNGKMNTKWASCIIDFIENNHLFERKEFHDNNSK